MLDKIHEVNFIMLKEIRDICDRHGIRVLLEAGTLLGAVRHKGFIPWDDDTDVMMTRSDWEKFRTVAPGELSPDIRLLTPKELAEDNKFYDFAPKLAYIPSRRNPENEETAFYDERLNHVCLDIFITDPMPDSGFSAFMMRTVQKLIYALSMGHRYKVRYSRYTGMQKFMLFLLSNAGKLVPMTFLERVQGKSAGKYNGKKTEKLFSASYPPEFFSFTVERASCEDPAEYEFEGETFLSVRDYDTYLRDSYGDYMTPPPESERLPKHGSGEIEVFE